jgi:hypothetical protein
LAWSSLERATPVAVVVPGALIKVAKLARVTSTLAPINTLPAVVPMEETKVKTTPLIVMVSVLVGWVARPNKPVQ